MYLYLYTYEIMMADEDASVARGRDDRTGGVRATPNPSCWVPKPGGDVKASSSKTSLKYSTTDRHTACLHKTLTSDRHLTQQNKPTTNRPGMHWSGWYTDSLSNLTTRVSEVRKAIQHKIEDWKGRSKGDRNTTPATTHTQRPGNTSEPRRTRRT